MENLWSGVLSAVLVIVSFAMRHALVELSRLSILLNRTREETARDYVTKGEQSAAISQVLARFDRLEEKIDRMVGSRK